MHDAGTLNHEDVVRESRAVNGSLGGTHDDGELGMTPLDMVLR